MPAEKSVKKAVPVITITGRALPYGWRRLHAFGPQGAVYASLSGLKVIETIANHSDGKDWHHVSASYEDRLPSWDDLTMVKRLFLGPHTTALQVFPPASRHVNIHPFCLHLWRCVDGDVTPDFTEGGRSI